MLFEQKYANADAFLWMCNVTGLFVTARVSYLFLKIYYKESVYSMFGGK